MTASISVILESDSLTGLGIFMKVAIRETIQMLSLAVFVFLILHSTVQNYRVEGLSMSPSLEDEQRILVNRIVYLSVLTERIAWIVPGWDEERSNRWYPFHEPRRGEMVVFKSTVPPHKDFIKRVIGITGDVVEISQGIVYVNGEALDEPYVKNAIRVHESWAPIYVKAGEYYVLGDNRDRSVDSRHWGLVPEKNIRGKPWISWWPLNQLRVIPSNF